MFTAHVYGGRKSKGSTGKLHWTTWNHTEGRAWGGLWLDNDIPCVACGTMTIYKVSVHVYRARSGVFTRMVITSQYNQRFQGFGTSTLQLHAIDGDQGWAWSRL